jgi:hypothetical protein
MSRSTSAVPVRPTGACRGALRHVGAGWIVGLLLVGAGLSASVTDARASRLRVLVPRVVRFATDGTRYAAWQVHVGGPIVVLDTVTRVRHEVPPPAGCNLENGEDSGDARTGVAVAGQFMLQCLGGTGSATGVLNVRSGRSVRLPDVSLRAEWVRLGSRYAQGYSQEDVCAHSAAEVTAGETGCILLFDLASGAVSYRPQGQVVDLDDPGAPSACPAVQRRGHLLGVNSLRGLTYADGVLASEGTRHNGDVELVRCHGRPTILPGRDEPRNINIGGGLLTWDNGLNPTESATTSETRTLISYGLSSRRRRSWALPFVAVKGQVEPQRAEPYGYSSHTANTVFWIAPRAIELALHGGGRVLGSSVYAARL